MTDDAYGLDFFQQVTDVHFGSPVWFACNTFVNQNGGPSSATVDASFPGIAGGTPGFALANGSSPITGPSKKVLTPKDLSSSIRTGAGQSLTGFSMGVKAPTGAAFAMQGLVFLMCTGPFGKTFTVRFDRLAPDGVNGVNTNVFLWGANKIKAGTRIDISSVSNVFPAPDAAANRFLGIFPLSTTVTYTVDPKNLTVTAS